jgi:hypothetical protein
MSAEERAEAWMGIARHLLTALNAQTEMVKVLLEKRLRDDGSQA